MLALLFILVPLCVIVVFAVIQATRLRRNPMLLRLGEVGTVMDRALRAYREDLPVLLLLGALFAPLGVLPNDGQMVSSVLLVLILPSLRGPELPALLWLLPVLNSLGIGRVLLACCVARVAQLRAAGAPVSLGAALRHGRWGGALALAALLAIPSLISGFFGVIGAVVGLLFSLAPALLLYEGVSPFQAATRGVGLAWRNFSAMLNTLVPLLLIAWLMLSVPVALLMLALSLFGGLDPNRQTLLLTVIYLAGNVCIAPLLAQGKVQLYLYVRGRSITPGQIMPPRSAAPGPMEQREVVQ